MDCVFGFNGTPRMIEVLSRCNAMIDEKKLEERLVALEAAKSWSPRVVSRLETLLRSGADEALYRINPIQFATEKSIAEAEAIDLFLHACVAGLFDMDWQLVCPMCSDFVESFRSLRKLHTHFHCHLCQSDYDAALDDYIMVTFTVSPAPTATGKKKWASLSKSWTKRAPSVASTSRLATEPGSIRVSTRTRDLAASFHGTPSGSTPSDANL